MIGNTSLAPNMDLAEFPAVFPCGAESGTLLLSLHPEGLMVSSVAEALGLANGGEASPLDLLAKRRRDPDEDDLDEEEDDDLDDDEDEDEDDEDDDFDSDDDLDDDFENDDMDDEDDIFYEEDEDE